ncbi:Cytochrome P450 [Mycena kentingensis (nom. inval.)]|nr:Cytochrome P450 [Mycena kentingensis (nom. inval.)]
MDPLSSLPQRPPSIRSLSSWWSDSNSIGATFNLHRLAKPLMGYMYHRQVQRSILSKKGASLLAQDMEVLRSYLLYQHTSLKSKQLILEHFVWRLSHDREARLLIAEAMGPPDVLMQVLETPPSPGIFRAACGLIAQLSADVNVLERFPEYQWWCPYDELRELLKGQDGAQIVATTHSWVKHQQLVHPDIPGSGLKLSRSSVDLIALILRKPNASALLNGAFADAFDGHPVAVVLCTAIASVYLSWHAGTDVDTTLDDFLANDLELFRPIFDLLPTTMQRGLFTRRVLAASDAKLKPVQELDCAEADSLRAERRETATGNPLEEDK